MGNMSGDYGSHYTLWQSIQQNYQHDIYTNVTVKMYLTFDGSSYYAYTNYATSGSMIIDGTTHNYSIASINFSSGQAKDILLAEWTGDIKHNETTGEKTLSVSGNWNTDTTRIGSGSCSASQKLTTIPRYSEINSVSVQSTGLTTAVIQYSVSRSANIYCSVDGGAYGNPRVSNTTSGTFTITGLSPNVQHSFKILARAVDSGLDRESGTFYGNTKDIARISNLANFEHGSNLTVGITNPASISGLSLVMKVGDVQILSRTVIVGNNTISFSDAELDNIYKKYGSSSSLTATFVLTGSGYTNTKSCTIALKGNQKTIKMNVSSSWKRGKLWLNISSTWRRAIVWQNVSGTWRRGI